MPITKEALHTVRLITLFIGKYGYVPTKITGQQTMDEIWLTKKKADKYPLIRISSYTASSDKYELTRIFSVFEAVIGNKLDNRQVLSIHYGFEDVKQVDDKVKIICLETNYCSDETILQDFEELKSIIMDVKPEELESDYRKALQQLNRTSQRISILPKVDSIKDIPLSYIISAICVLICLIARWLSSQYDDQVTGVLLMGAYYKTLILGNNEWWRLLTTGFVHYTFYHLFSNVISLVSIGKIVEEEYGRIKMIICLIISIICGSLFLLVANSNSVVVGISAGIYGLIGLVIVYLFESGVIHKKEVRNSMIKLIILNLIISFLPSVSFIGHIGGFVGGILFGIIISKKEDWKSLRINTIIASCALLAVLGFGIVKDTKKTPIYTGTDSLYINALKDFNLEKYADYTIRNLNKYYIEVENLYNEKN